MYFKENGTTCKECKNILKIKRIKLPEMSDSDESLNQSANLWTLPANQINQLDPYR